VLVPVTMPSRRRLMRETCAVTEWEYRKIDLNQQHPRGDELDLLNNAGADGWELVAILPNNIAYLKRPIHVSETIRAEEAIPSAQTGTDGNRVNVGKHFEVKAKYRDPKTNETWSGRGRMANWLKKKQEAGEDIEEYLV
jgi:hypothetical protein